jgi:hypothetical protein
VTAVRTGGGRLPAGRGVVPAHLSGRSQRLERAGSDMCYQCTLLGPLIQVDKRACQHAFGFMAQLDHRLERVYFDMSKQVRRQATGADGASMACVEPFAHCLSLARPPPARSRRAEAARGAHSVGRARIAGSNTRRWTRRWTCRPRFSSRTHSCVAAFALRLRLPWSLTDGRVRTRNCSRARASRW